MFVQQRGLHSAGGTICLGSGWSEGNRGLLTGCQVASWVGTEGGR